MAALLSSLLATAACRALARRFGIMSRPNPMVAQHVRPVAYLGGVGLAVGLAAGALCLLAAAGATTPAAAVRWEVVAGAVAFLAIGLADDLLAFAPAPKLLLQSLAAVGVAALLPPPASLADRAVAVVLVVALSNAMNLVDVCDGLATSLALVTTIALAALAPATLPLALVLVGAGAGFLVFNAPPASIFLGDAGSLLLGFLLAMQSLDAWRAAPAPRTAVALALAHGVPVFEVFLLVVVRARRGASWWSCSPDHFALRLQARGWSRWRVIGAACGIAAGLGALAVVASRNAPGAAAAMAVALLAATLAWRALTRA